MGRGGARLRLAGAQRSRCSGGRFNLCSPGWCSPGARVGRRCSAAACSRVDGDGERRRMGKARGGGAAGVLRAPGSRDSTREGPAKVQRAGGQGGMESTGGEESWRRTEIPTVAFGTNSGHCRGCGRGWAAPRGSWAHGGGEAADRRWQTRRRRSNVSEMAEKCCEKMNKAHTYIGWGPFVPGEATTQDKRAFCPGSWLHPGQKVFLGGPGKFLARGPPLVPGGSTTRDKRGPFSLIPVKSYI